MFKGLRNKIESEQKGGPPPSPASPQRIAATTSNQKQQQRLFHNQQLISQTNHEPISSTQIDENYLPSAQISNTPEAGHAIADDTNSLSSMKSSADKQSADCSTLNYEFEQLRIQLDSERTRRDAIERQNAALSQTIEELRTSLASRDQENAELQEQLKGAQASLKERDALINGFRNPRFTSGLSLSGKVSPALDVDDSEESAANLCRKLDELQGQVSEKNRLLKLRQQNLNDMKRALQRELMDHSKTQKELGELQQRLLAEKKCDNLVDSSASTSAPNGTPSEADSKISDKTQNQGNQADQVASTSNEEYHTQQSDVGSCHSKSSVSIDEYDSNDLQGNFSNSKDVNHEYLRNVLYRYMTSTDKETAQHLVKALSVLMNFNQEQCSIIKKAMQARASWLRLN